MLIFSTAIYLVLAFNHHVIKIRGEYLDMDDGFPSAIKSQIEQSCAEGKRVIHRVCHMTRQSCWGRCGSSLNISSTDEDSLYCACDSTCQVYGDCCWDFRQHCPSQALAGDSFGFLHDISTSCVDKNRVIVGCSSKAASDQSTFINGTYNKLAPIVSVRDNNSALVHFQNYSVYQCNMEHFHNPRLMYWLKNVSALTARAGSLLQEFFNDTLSDDLLYHHFDISDSPPNGVIERACYPKISFACISSFCPLRILSLENMRPLCAFIDAHFENVSGGYERTTTERTSTVSYWSTLSTENISTSLSDFTSMSTVPTSTTVFHGGNIPCREIFKAKGIKNKSPMFSMLLDVSNPLTTNVISRQVGGFGWEDVTMCLLQTNPSQEAAELCTSSVECSFGFLQYDDWKCILPSELYATIESKLRDQLEFIPNFFTKALEQLKPLPFMKAAPLAVQNINSGDRWTLVITWRLLSYPFKESSSAHLEVSRQLMDVFITDLDYVNGLFRSGDNVTLCVVYLSEFRKCDMIVVNGFLNTKILGSEWASSTVLVTASGSGKTTLSAASVPQTTGCVSFVTPHAGDLSSSPSLEAPPIRIHLISGFGMVSYLRLT